MFTNPTAPNLQDYLSFLYGTVGIPQANLPSVTGVATGGDTGFLEDDTQDWTANQWVGFLITDVTQGASSSVVGNDDTRLFFATALPDPVQLADAYLVMPSVVEISLSIAQEIVNPVLQSVSAQIYLLAVYNLAADRLINFAQDVPDQSYFLDLRTTLRLTNVSVGVSSSVNDQGTAVGILNPEQMKFFTLQDLQTLKTPYGRQYMAFAQMYGRTTWGVS